MSIFKKTQREAIFFFAGALMASVSLYSCVESNATPEDEPSPTFQVSRVVDGDTMLVRMTAEHTFVRIIGIDAPEATDSEKPSQCFGREATKRLEDLVAGKKVTLIAKPDGDRDAYLRLLRYVEIDGRDIGATLIEEGFVRSFPAFPHPRLELYKDLERGARSSSRGLWGQC